MRTVRLTTLTILLAMLIATGSAWAVTALTVDSVAPTRDVFSLKVDFDGSTTAAFVADTSPVDETHLYAEFFVNLDPAFSMNFGTPATADRFNLLRVKDNALAGSDPPIRIILKRGLNGIIVQGLVKDDNLVQTGTRAILLTQGAWQRIRVDWQAASAPGANDGYLRIRRGNGQVKARENLDNDTHGLDRQELGAPGGVDTGTTGRMTLDDYTSLRATPADWL